MEEWDNSLQQSFLDNSLADYLWFAGILVTGLILKKFLSKLLSRLLYWVFRRYGKHVGVEKFIALLFGTCWVLLLVVIVYFLVTLEIPKRMEPRSGKCFGVRFVLIQVFQGAMVLAFTWIATRVIEFIGLVMKSRAAQTESKLDDQLVPL